VIYEVHVGTFTPEGTFAAAAARVDHLADIGITPAQKASAVARRRRTDRMERECRSRTGDAV
jgi:hypothetical protein